MYIPTMYDMQLITQPITQSELLFIIILSQLNYTLLLLKKLSP
jgi:hypothetical protein